MKQKMKQKYYIGELEFKTKKECENECDFNFL